MVCMYIYYYVIIKKTSHAICRRRAKERMLYNIKYLLTLAGFLFYLTCVNITNGCVVLHQKCTYIMRNENTYVKYIYIYIYIFAAERRVIYIYDFEAARHNHIRYT